MLPGELKLRPNKGVLKDTRVQVMKAIHTYDFTCVGLLLTFKHIWVRGKNLVL